MMKLEKLPEEATPLIPFLFYRTGTTILTQNTAQSYLFGLL